MNTFSKLLTLIIVFSYNLSNIYAQSEVKTSNSSTLNSQEKQKKIFISLGGGYNFGMNKQTINYFQFYDYKLTSFDYSAKNQLISLGEGWNFGGAIGFMFSKNFGIEIAVSNLYSNTFKGEYITNLYKRDFSLSSKMLQVTPTLILTTGTKKINPYAKLGFITGFGSINFKEDAILTSGVPISTETELKGGTAFGVNTKFGLDFNVSPGFSLFSEINIISLSYSPTKGGYTKYTYAGTDQLPYMSSSNKDIEFVDEYSYDIWSYQSQDKNKPQKRLKENFPYSSIGIQIGTRFFF